MVYFDFSFGKALPKFNLFPSFTPIDLVLNLAEFNMLHMSTSISSPSAFATRKDVPPHSASYVPEVRSSDPQRQASVVLIVPIIDERHHGADLLMIPISDDNNRFARPKGQTSPAITTGSRTETPSAPTPPPKPQLPKGCEDWDSYLSQKKSTATLPLCENEGEWIKPAVRIQSPELNFKHSFEQLGWRDCLNQAQRQKANARVLRHRPSGVTLAPTVYDASSPGNSSSNSNSNSSGNNSNNSSSATSVRSAKRLSNASTLTTNTIAEATPFYLPSTAYKRLSNASILTTNTAPCVLGGASLRNAKRLSAASTLTANTVATVPCYLSSSTSYKRLSNASTLTTSTFSSIASNGKPRSLRRINRARHLRTYYSDGSLLRGRRLSVGISSMQGIAERREPERRPVGNRFSAASMPLVNLRGELCAPPPYPPPEKPLPSLPVIEVRELQTGERTRWRELLLRSFPRRESSRRRAGGVTVR